MAWDTLQPTNTTKIRNLGVVIRPNWAAIQNAESSFRPDAINFKNRTPAVVPINPAAIANTYISFCKEDAAGNPELFGINPSSQVVQMTQGLALGSIVTPIKAQTLSFDGTFTNNQNAMVTAWAFVTVTGAAITAQVGNGITFARNSTGSYTATFTASQVTNANYAVIGTAYSSGAATEGRLVSFDASAVKNTNNFSIIITHSTSDNRRDASFFICVLGGR